MNDKERIAELADAYNRLCAENADFVAESIKADRRIAELTAQLKHAEGYAGELEGDVKDLHADIARLTTEAYTREAEVKTLRVCAEKYNRIGYVSSCGVVWENQNPHAQPHGTIFYAAREGK